LAASGVRGAVNIGSGDAVAVRDVIGHVARACGRPDLVRLGARAAPANDPPLLVADVARLRDEVGWRPGIELANGLREAASWWSSNRAA
ncbi:MAG: NAD(P)-dependent oxidoreductase, partial [Gemmata sp.]